MTIGIYLLNFANKNEVYIGQSSNIERRYQQHLRDLKLGICSNYKLKDFYDKYSYPELVILETCEISELYNLEKIWLEEFDSLYNGLNIIEAGISGRGINSNNSKYTKFQILKVFILLYKYNNTRKQISLRLNVPEHLVKAIATGRTHVWLQEQYPEKYNIIRNNSKNLVGGRGKAINKKKDYYPLLIDRELNIHNIGTSIKEWVSSKADLNTNIGASRQGISDLIGKRSLSYKGYKLYVSGSM
jgi:predicted GIY-YIG superfamily endonuclease